MRALYPTATHSGAGENKSWVRLVAPFCVQLHNTIFLYTLHVYFNININIWACTLIIPVSLLSREHPATQRPGCGHCQHWGPWLWHWQLPQQHQGLQEDPECQEWAHAGVSCTARCPPEHLALLLVKQKIPRWAMGLSRHSKLAVFPGRLKQ